ncbi:MAG: hypothetical protein NDI81_14530 [Desulfobacula sp.]|nr:hypothetical protein [Desulfobacula sp.]
MTQIKSLCLILILILILALLVLTAGPNAFPDMQFDYALQCYQKKDYETAVVEFKRFDHFFPGTDGPGRPDSWAPWACIS